MLTPDQITQARTQFNIKPVSDQSQQTSPEDRSKELDDAWGNNKQSESESEADPNDFLKIKANNTPDSFSDAIKTPIKSVINLATAPVRAAKNLLYDIPKASAGFSEDSKDLTIPERAEALGEGFADTAKTIAKPFSFTGNVLAGTFAHLVKSTTGLDISNKDAEDALNTLGDHLINNKLADTTNVVQAVHKLVTENPEQLVPILEGVNETVSKAKGTPVDVVSDAAKATKIPQAIDSTIQTGKNVINKASAPFKESYLPDVAKEFEQEGIKPPISAITKSPFLQGAESLSAKTAFGRKIIDQVKNVNETLESKTQDIVDKLKPVKTVSDENLGKTIQEGLNEYETHFKATEDKVYQTFAEKYGKSQSYTPDTKATLSQIISEQGKDYFKGIDPKLQTFFDRLVGETPKIKSLRKELSSSGVPEDKIESEVAKISEPPVLNFDEIKSTRTSVGEQLAKDPENTALKRVYGALSRDMSSAVSATDEDGAGALQKLNAKYKAGKDKIESRISTSIAQSNPERIAQNLITRNSADTLSTVKEMIGPKRFQEVQKAFFRNVFDDSMNRGKFDVSKLKKNLANYDNDTLQQALNPQQLDDLHQAIMKLERIDRLKGAMKVGEKYSQGSQTAFLSHIGGMGTRIGGIVGALASGNIPLAVGLLGDIGGEAMYSKLFTSEFGKKLLTEGFSPISKEARVMKLRETKSTFDDPIIKKPSTNFGIKNGKLIEPPTIDKISDNESKPIR